MEDVKGSITRQENGKYLLTVSDEENRGGTKEITGDEAAAILFCSFDPSNETYEDPYQVASAALEGFQINLIP
jgi:hypothetical protein